MSETSLTFGQIIVITLLGSGIFSGMFTLLSKKLWSPESKNKLAEIAAGFAEHMLSEARLEREELRSTIDELEKINATKQHAIEKLKQLAEQKDKVIKDLEHRQFSVARKIYLGQSVTFKDIFGDNIPTAVSDMLDIETFNRKD